MLKAHRDLDTLIVLLRGAFAKLSRSFRVRASLRGFCINPFAALSRRLIEISRANVQFKNGAPSTLGSSTLNISTFQNKRSTASESSQLFSRLMRKRGLLLDPRRLSSFGASPRRPAHAQREPRGAFADRALGKRFPRSSRKLSGFRGFVSRKPF